MSMQNTFLYFLSMLVESIALSCCILAVFRDQKDLRKRDFILVPSVSLCLLIARSSYGGASPGFHLTQGFFLAPADNFPILLILLMGLLLLTSTLLNTQDGGRTFCGTMAAFSLYLLCHFCAVIFTIFFNKLRYRCCEQRCYLAAMYLRGVPALVSGASQRTANRLLSGAGTLNQCYFIFYGCLCVHIL